MEEVRDGEVGEGGNGLVVVEGVVVVDILVVWDGRGLV